MGQQPNVFRIGGSVLRMFQVLTVASFAMSGLFLYSSFTGKESSWGIAALTFASGLVLLGVSVITPGILTISEDGIEIKRRFGAQHLRWADIKRVRWAGHGTGVIGLVAGAASDNWQVWIEGTSGERPITLVVTGPSVERQAEVRELLTARLRQA